VLLRFDCVEPEFHPDLSKCLPKRYPRKNKGDLRLDPGAKFQFPEDYSVALSIYVMGSQHFKQIQILLALSSVPSASSIYTASSISTTVLLHHYISLVAVFMG
jgi:hypothetical protein